jgi:hypothetical protein
LPDLRPDAAIVSYPKSGNTWVRFLIANILKRHDDEVVDFHSVQKYVPELGRHDDDIRRLPAPRIVKSHGYDARAARKVVYVLRDGRDAYVSYYFHLQARLALGTTFLQFLASPHVTSEPWVRHVSHWIIDAAPHLQRLVVRYEDLLADCERELSRITDFLGLEVTRERVDAAVRASTFARLRELEVERGRPYRSSGPDVFVRRGEAGNWREFFGPEEIALFKMRDGDALLRLGYESDPSWGNAVPR